MNAAVAVADAGSNLVRCRVYVDVPHWTLRPKNTDWRYNFALRGIEQDEPLVRLYYPRGHLHAFRLNLEHGLAIARHRLGIVQRRPAASNPYIGRLDEGELSRFDANVVFSHGKFPINARGLPVLWQNTVLDPEMQRFFGVSEDTLQQDIEHKREAFTRAAGVQVSTQAERKRLQRTYPKLADRFLAIPFYFDYLQALSAEVVCRKHEEPGFRLLFVGREATRKGLDILLDAMRLLEWPKRSDCEATIVSTLADGEIDVPGWNNVRHLVEAGRKEVIGLMQRAHVFAMPSRLEGYGFTYVEAMAAGTVPVVPDWEVQREIVDYGRAGCVVRPDAQAVAQALECLIGERERRRAMALKALERFELHYSRRAVGRTYVEAFECCSKRSKAENPRQGG